MNWNLSVKLMHLPPITLCPVLMFSYLTSLDHMLCWGQRNIHYKPICISSSWNGLHQYPGEAYFELFVLIHPVAKRYCLYNGVILCVLFWQAIYVTYLSSIAKVVYGCPCSEMCNIPCFLKTIPHISKWYWNRFCHTPLCFFRFHSFYQATDSGKSHYVILK